MTIQESVQSGKHFKRPAMSAWFYRTPAGLIRQVGTGPFVEITATDILADDWEAKLEPLKVSIPVEWFKTGGGTVYPAVIYGTSDEMSFKYDQLVGKQGRMTFEESAE